MRLSQSDVVERVGDLVDLPSRPTVNDVVETVRTILAKPYVYIDRIVIEVGKPISVDWRGSAADTLINGPSPDPAIVLRDVEMVEASGATVAETLGKAVLAMESRGTTVTHAAVGVKSVLWRWLGIDLSTALSVPSSVAGGAIVTSPNLGPYDLIMFGGKDRGTQLADASFAARVLMEIQENAG